MLIITIVVMLILVAVNIDLIIDGRLFNSTEKAVTKTNKKVEQQQSRIDELMGELNELDEREKNEKNQSIISDIQNGIELVILADTKMCEIDGMLLRLEEISFLIAGYWSNEDTAEENISMFKSEISGLYEEIDSVSSTTMFDNENLLDGTFARDVGVSGMFLQIDDLSSAGLGLNIGSIDADFATQESTEAYKEKIRQARQNFSRIRTTVGCTHDRLGSLKRLLYK